MHVLLVAALAVLLILLLLWYRPAPRGAPPVQVLLVEAPRPAPPVGHRTLLHRPLLARRPPIRRLLHPRGPAWLRHY